MAKKKEENYLIISPSEIVSLFFRGKSINSLTKYVSNNEGIKRFEARQKVEKSIFDYYLKNGLE